MIAVWLGMYLNVSFRAGSKGNFKYVWVKLTLNCLDKQRVGIRILEKNIGLATASVEMQSMHLQRGGC